MRLTLLRMPRHWTGWLVLGVCGYTVVTLGFIVYAVRLP